MRYAAALANAGPCGHPRALAELARLAEDAGWDAVLLEDYIITPNEIQVYDPWICLAAMAIATGRIRIGTLVTPLPRRRPWKLAREALTIDHLSNGRMILGVGLGDARMDYSFAKFGEPTDYRTRAELADEALEIISGLWTGRPFKFARKHVHIDEVTFLPKPVQSSIPIWIGGIWPRKSRALERAFRYDGFAGYLGAVGTDEHGAMTADDVAQIRKFAIERGKDSAFDVVVGGWPRNMDLGKERQHRRECASAGATWWQEYVIGTPNEIRATIRTGPVIAD